jgi:hypothetical protein
VVVLDGLGHIAASNAAHALALQGCEVFLVARTYAVGAQIDSTTRPVIERDLRESGVQALAGKAVVSFYNNCITLRDTFSGKHSTLSEISALVYDVGGRANDTLFHELTARRVNVVRVGDCVAPRGMQDAWREGFEAARSI